MNKFFSDFLPVAGNWKISRYLYLTHLTHFILTHAPMLARWGVIDLILYAC